MYYRDPNVSSEFIGPFDESTVNNWYREGYFHTGIQFRLGNCSGYTTLGRLRELNGIACPFAPTINPEDEESRCLEEQLREAKGILNEMGERIKLLEVITNEINDDFKRNQIDAEGMKTMVDKLMDLQTQHTQAKHEGYQRFINEILGGEAVNSTAASPEEIVELIELYKRIKKKGNINKLHAALKPHYAAKNCMLKCGASLSSPHDFTGHICSIKHVKWMNETGVSRKSVMFFIDQFEKFE